MRTDLPISIATWNALVSINAASGWAEPGVFGPGVGPGYWDIDRPPLMVVGKSAGPLGSAVGSGFDQRMSVDASTKWMLDRRNARGFWTFVDRIDSTRRSIAWTNVCKFDRKGGLRPPAGREWSDAREECLAALHEELDYFRPALCIFLISDTYRHDCIDLVRRRGFSERHCLGEDRQTLVFTQGAQTVVFTRHPQGWSRDGRDRVISYCEELRNGGQRW